MRVLVCGGRDFKNVGLLEKTLQEILEKDSISLIIHGDARGADRLAGQWAKSRGIEQIAEPAKWDEYGKGAGHIRNEYMLKVYQPDLVVAFEGGKGTQNMIDIALAVNVLVMQVRE